MRRYSLLLVALSVLLSAVVVSPARAVFPIPDGYKTLKMEQGYYMDNIAWFICTDTNDIRWAMTENLTLARKLTSFLNNAARAMLVVTNFNQGPIFSQRPGIANYSALWRVFTITWDPGVPRRPITNNQAAGPMNPQGIPPWMGANKKVTLVETNVVLDCPIVALGRLGGPWQAKPDPPFYRIPQARNHNPWAKTITLPYWNVFCDDPITRRVTVQRVIIPDVGDAALARTLGANLAPRLLMGPDRDTQRFWVMRFPKPPSQLPVIEECPSSLSWRNTNNTYSPVMRYTVLSRNIPPWAVVNNDTFLQTLIGGGLLVVMSENQRINAPIIDGLY